MDGIVPSETPNFTIRIVASDGFGGSAFIDINWVVLPNHNPVVLSSIPTQIVTVGVPMTLIIPNNLFMDPDNDVLTYSARQVLFPVTPTPTPTSVLTDTPIPTPTSITILPLPAWLNFNSDINMFFGTETQDAENVNIRLYADDNRADPAKTGDPAYIDFMILINHPPIINVQPDDYVCYPGDTFSIRLDFHTFIDPDNDPMTYSAYQVMDSIESQLSSWISFDTVSFTFSGHVPPLSTLETIPSAYESRILRVRANDGRGGLSNVDFLLNILVVQNRLLFQASINNTTNKIEIFSTLLTDNSDNSFGSDGNISVFMNNW